MPKIDRISTLQYMGSKSRMLENICAPIIENADIHCVIDLFAGTGSVGYALSPYKAIVSNDLEYYAFILNEAILNGCMMKADELDAILMSIGRNYQTIKEYLKQELAAEEKYLSAPSDSYSDYAVFSSSTPSVFNREANTQAFKKLKELVDMVKHTVFAYR